MKKQKTVFTWRQFLVILCGLHALLCRRDMRAESEVQDFSKVYFTQKEGKRPAVSRLQIQISFKFLDAFI